MEKLDILLNAIQAKREGLKPMRAIMLSPHYGPSRGMYEFQGRLFETHNDLTAALKSFKVIDGRPNIIFFRQTNNNDKST